MTTKEIQEMIEGIQQLPDSLLIRLITVTTAEMLKRTAYTLTELKRQLKDDNPEP